MKNRWLVLGLGFFPQKYPGEKTERREKTICAEL